MNTLPIPPLVASPRRLLSLLALWLLWLLWLGLAGRAEAGIADAPPDRIEVSLITYGPGDVYWERFGHDAIELRDRLDGEAIAFNYGVFDFDEAGFLLNFARGHMHYLMDAAPSELDRRDYVAGGRSVSRLRLNFNAAQTQELRQFLLWNLRPEHARYDYDYYTSNCATRVRDALDHALDGALEGPLRQRPARLSYRQQTARLMSHQVWLMLILDLGLGPYADQPLDAWRESFLPMVLEQNLRTLTVAGADGRPRPLVFGEQLISANRLVPPPASAPELRWPLLLAGLMLAAALALSHRYLPALFAVLGTLYLLLAGVAGLLLILLWTCTTHRSAWANANLLLFNPLAWLLLPTLWRARRGIAAFTRGRLLLAAQLVAIVVALGLHLLPGVAQQNQPWLLFALPVWLILAWRLRKGLRRVRR